MASSLVKGEVTRFRGEIVTSRNRKSTKLRSRHVANDKSDFNAIEAYPVFNWSFESLADLRASLVTRTDKRRRRPADR